MKGKGRLIASLFQLIIGALAIAAFALLSHGGEDMTRWIITLILAVAYVIMGIAGIVAYKKSQE